MLHYRCWYRRSTAPTKCQDSTPTSPAPVKCTTSARRTDNIIPACAEWGPYLINGSSFAIIGIITTALMLHRILWSIDFYSRLKTVDLLKYIGQWPDVFKSFASDLVTGHSTSCLQALSHIHLLDLAADESSVECVTSSQSVDYLLRREWGGNVKLLISIIRSTSWTPRTNHNGPSKILEIGLFNIIHIQFSILPKFHWRRNAFHCVFHGLVAGKFGKFFGDENYITQRHQLFKYCTRLFQFDWYFQIMVPASDQFYHFRDVYNIVAPSL